MKKTFLLLSLAAFTFGCSTYYPPRASIYSDYGFTYDYKESPVPSAADIPASTYDTGPAPTFLVQVPPPTVIYQSTPAPIQTSVDTNVVAESNPYKGTYLIPPKVVVVPQQTVIRESAGAVPGSTVTTTTQPGTVYPSPGYANPNYLYPGAVGFIGVDTNTNTVVITNNPITATNLNVGVTNSISNQNTISNVVSITNVNEAAGAQNTNAPAPTNAPPFTPTPGTTNNSAQRFPNQATVPTTAGGSFAPPPGGATPLPGQGPATRTTAGGSFAPPPSGTTPLPGTSQNRAPAGGSFAPPPPGTTPLPGQNSGTKTP